MNTTAQVDKSSSRVRKMFGEIAPQYDRMNHLLSMNVDRLWRWRTVRKLRPQKGNRILDVCTGTGDLAIAFSKHCRRKFGPNSVKISATDFCPEMLEIGKTKIGPETMIEFSEADAQSLPFLDNEFDIVTVAFGLRNVTDTDLGLRELTRVCRPGGQVAVLEFTTPRIWPIRPLYQWYFRNVLPKIGQRLARNNSAAYEYLPSSVGEFPMYQALADRMQQSGLQQVVFYPLTLGIATLYVGVK
ncbi:MAG TPA: bifunctional demethylmenaquinone methyltransferase/2-methoxy-6-polyprenyl-1,4-benzoquinol methylase UbiE [Pirellulaceae bacterium]|nr:bifunctional demethylmenaquinone methyltransferase/2-methoxy-6-polyprenyl-1,4-benzoquinol methylase UbiE [Pirellulaceae bacterium]HMO92624.1 bifunctional demethylmenaquinone methyltransferase/2-methoxy-6-polyprenyl-1,4-benzoquinol methylase UbiE [Pirellulaceae bacterium]HMP70228.1 bifunctional demethylmenaquinone methyltransferase/2-methoxy-6-polyprenyl-1,4-benzoquinol methylase UbiE [Pirellulaceae bacterium]